MLCPFALIQFPNCFRNIILYPFALMQFPTCFRNIILCPFALMQFPNCFRNIILYSFFLLLQKKRIKKKETLHEVITSYHSLSQLHACSPFQFERNYVVSLFITNVQWFDLIHDFSLGENFKNLHSQISNLQSSIPVCR